MEITTGTTFVDSSINKSAITPYGNAKTVTTQSKIGGSSAYFDGSGDYLFIDNPEAFNVLNLAFSIECWIYVTGTPSTSADIATNNDISKNGWGFRLNSNMKIYFIYNFSASSSGGSSIVSTTTLSLNTWYHIAGVKQGSNTYLFVNGVLEATANVGTTAQYNTNIGLSIGRNTTNSSWYYTGYINDLRVTKGIVRYTTNFTPPNQRFYDLLTELKYFYGVYSDFLRVVPGETLGVSNTVEQYPVPFRDMEDGGTSFVEGYVTYNGVPASRRVRLCILQSGRLVRETWSDSITRIL